MGWWDISCVSQVQSPWVIVFLALQSNEHLICLSCTPPLATWISTVVRILFKGFFPFSQLPAASFFRLYINNPKQSHKLHDVPPISTLSLRIKTSKACEYRVLHQWWPWSRSNLCRGTYFGGGQRSAARSGNLAKNRLDEKGKDNDMMIIRMYLWVVATKTYFWNFSSGKLGKMNPFWGANIFSIGLVQPPTRYLLKGYEEIEFYSCMIQG